MSRPALYLLFPNKEEIFKAAIRQIAGENLGAIRAGLEAYPTEAGKLRFAFEVWCVEPFRLMLQLPDAKELVDCTHGFCARGDGGDHHAVPRSAGGGAGAVRVSAGVVRGLGCAGGGAHFECGGAWVQGRGGNGGGATGDDRWADRVGGGGAEDGLMGV